MEKSRYTDSQIMSILKQAEAGAKVSDLCRERGMSDASFYKWRGKYGRMNAPLMTCMKELEAENIDVLIGFGVSIAVAKFANWPVFFWPEAIGLSILSAAMVCVSFCLYPAHEASRRNPIGALSFE